MVNTYKIIAIVIALQLLMGIVTTAQIDATNSTYNTPINTLSTDTNNDISNPNVKGTQTGIWSSIVQGTTALWDNTVGRAIDLGKVILKYLWYFTIAPGDLNPFTETNQLKAIIGYIIVIFRSILTISLLMLLYDKYKNKKPD